MFFIAHSHNSIGRFYEVQSYGPIRTRSVPARRQPARNGSGRTRRCLLIKWGPRNNTNIQESALLFSLSHVAKNRELYLENYWLKNKRAVDKGKSGPTFAWVIPATQRRKADAADAVNELRMQGLEVQRAASSFKAGSVDVKAGDYIIRGDQPFRTLADMYFSVQNYPPQNPSPYDDTGWTFQYMRDIQILPVSEKSVLDQPMTMLTAAAKASGGIEGAGGVLVVDDTADNNIVTFRFKNSDVKMLAAEDDFELGGHAVPRRIDRDPERRPREARADAEGPRALGVGNGHGASREDARPRHPAHRLRPQLDAHPGRRLVARGRSTRSACPTRILPIRN